MKYIPLAVVLSALIPSLVYAQNTQFSDCRTLEAAGNNVGPDEALVDGMVCKVVKPKASSWVTSPASGKTAPTENRMALFHELGGPGLIGQRAAGQIASQISAERRAADFVAARHGVASAVHALLGLGGVPEARQIGMTVR